MKMYPARDLVQLSFHLAYTVFMTSEQDEVIGGMTVKGLKDVLDDGVPR